MAPSLTGKAEPCHERHVCAIRNKHATHSLVANHTQGAEFELINNEVREKSGFPLHKAKKYLMLTRLTVSQEFEELPKISSEPRSPPVSPGIAGVHLIAPVDIYVKTQTWPIDQRGLLHHNSSAVSTREFKVRTSCHSFVMQRHLLDVDLVASADGTATAEHLLCLEPPHNGVGGYTVERKPGNLWEVLAASTPTAVSTADILRFGSLKLRVAQVVESPSDVGGFSLMLPSDRNTPERASVDDASDSEQQCRICFDEEETASNPLLAPCECRGSVRFIHSECLMHWMEGQLLLRRLPEGGGCYILRELTCELCKMPYTGNVYSRMLIRRPTVPHLVLEELTEGVVSKVHVVPIKKSLSIGRSKECDIWLGDISVSRRHARLIVDGGDRSIAAQHGTEGAVHSPTVLSQ